MGGALDTFIENTSQQIIDAKGSSDITSLISKYDGNPTLLKNEFKKDLGKGEIPSLQDLKDEIKKNINNPASVFNKLLQDSSKTNPLKNFFSR